MTDYIENTTVTLRDLVAQGETGLVVRNCTVIPLVFVSKLFSSAKVSGLTFENCKFRSGNKSGERNFRIINGVFENCRFTKCDLGFSDALFIEGGQVSNITFEGCKLQARFNNCKIVNSKFGECKFKKSIFVGDSFENVDFNDSTFFETAFGECKYNNVSFANISAYDLTRIDSHSPINQLPKGDDFFFVDHAKIQTVLSDLQPTLINNFGFSDEEIKALRNTFDVRDPMSSSVDFWTLKFVVDEFFDRPVKKSDLEKLFHILKDHYPS